MSFNKQKMIIYYTPNLHYLIHSDLLENHGLYAQTLKEEGHLVRGKEDS